MSSERLQSYFNESLQILKQCLELYQSGQVPFYRVVAVQLRLLLCDTTREHDKRLELGLVPRLLKDVYFPAVDEKGRRIASLPALDLDAWLLQTIQVEGRTLSLRQFIRQVCDQDGGAHVDEHRKDHLALIGEERDVVISLGKIVLSALQNNLD